MAKLYRKQDRADLAFPHADLVGKQQLESDNPSLLIFVAQTAILATQFDECVKYCKILKEKFTGNEQVLATVSKHLTLKLYTNVLSL